jgi:transcriptional regulator with XRE-family HTH domain
VDLVLILRARRSAQGWELYDLLEAEGITQADAAARLGITPQAASKRAQAAQLRAERAAIGPLSQLFDELDRA